MFRRSPILIATAILVLIATALPAGATALTPPHVLWTPHVPDGWARTERAEAVSPSRFAVTRKDGNDVKGPLDLASMKISRGKSQDTISFSTFGPVTNADIDPDNGNFAILIDTNDDKKYEYGLYLLFAAGKIRGLLMNLKTDKPVDTTVPTSRTGPRSFRQVIQRAKIHSPGTYRFALFGVYASAPCGRTCLDGIPNRYPLIPLDHKAPTFGWDDVQAYAADASDELTSPVEFHVADDKFGTGIREWQVQRREVLDASSGWKTVANGSGASPTVDVDGDEGATYDLRVIVIDRQKNRRISNVRRTTFPYDDDLATYDPLVTQDSAATGWFLGTRSGISNTVLPGTATFPFTGDTGTEVCVMGGPVASGTATADVALDGVPQLPMTEDVSVIVRSRIQCYTTTNADPHTLEITATSAATFWIDGFTVVP